MTQESLRHERCWLNPLRLIVTAFAVVLSLLSASCGESKPVKSSALHVDSEGRYTLDGTKVEPSNLKDALSSLGKSGNTVELRIHTRANSNYQAVGRAVQAAQEARIDIVVFVEEPLK
ncbi:hypothetical protein C1O66_21210 [Paucibacter aquatile]|uniref:Biopolymer transporter ExbD n=1 Tax=Kinneretia aquatilis TaxID=2070761 RepID=A0A2N8KRZ9_9BURK|nr:hypothetical protein C1O66_21210 [Paucibacter aquatile]